MHILYILMRNDLDSLNPGKAMAQASHASNAFIYDADKSSLFSSRELSDQLEEWEKETPQGFGTVLVLGASMSDIQNAVNLMQDEYICGIVHDPTYPIRDGNVTHFIPLDTCAYVFVPNKEEDMMAKAILSQFELHP